MFFYFPFNIVQDADSSNEEEEASPMQALASPRVEAVGVQHQPAWKLRVRSLFNRTDVDARVRRWHACFGTPEDATLWNEIEQAVRERVRSQNARFRFSSTDLEDIQQDVQVQLWPCLALETASRVRDYDAFVNAVVRNAFKRRIRQGKPIWSGLKDEVIEVLRGKRAAMGFAVWRCAGRELCGYDVWEGSDVRSTPGYLAMIEDARPLRRHVSRTLDPQRTALPELMKAVFDWLGTPVSVNELTTLLFDLRGEAERGSVPLASTHDLRSPIEGPEKSALRNAALAALAPAFAELPRDKAAAFFFHLPGPAAECLLLRLGAYEQSAALVADKLGIASNALERAMDDEMPWRDLQIAEFLAIRRPEGTDSKKTDHALQQAVINLRQAAIRSIRQMMEEKQA
jgi:hypothetical protein